MINTQSCKTVLSRQSQKTYDALAKGLLAGKNSIRIIEKDHSVIGSVFERIRHDYPQLYFVENIQYQTYSDSSVVTVNPKVSDNNFCFQENK